MNHRKFVTLSTLAAVAAVKPMSGTPSKGDEALMMEVAAGAWGRNARGAPRAERSLGKHPCYTEAAD